MNSVGLVAAFVAFLAIWFGHVAVRKLEYVSPSLWPAMLAVIGLGMCLLTLSLFTAEKSISTALGILGVISLWDAFELVRQQRRVHTGHAPANPNNPRHAAMLVAPDSRATTLDLLKREPLGHPVDADEAIRLLTAP